MTSILDYSDRTTCVLFGDGAGAVLLEPATDDTGILDFHHEMDGSGTSYLNMPAGGSARPASHETVDKRMHSVRQDGPHVFKYAVRKFAEVSLKVLERNRRRPGSARPVRGPSGEPPDHRRGQGADAASRSPRS